MRYLVLLQGIPGSGKSTFIQNKALEPYTISTDDLRLLQTAPILQAEGKSRIGIDQGSSKKAWKLLYELLDNRMKDGHFTIVDATHCNKKTIRTYKNLANQYKYRVFIVKFEVDPEIAYERNRKRENYKFVGQDVINRMYNNLKTIKNPSWAKTITPEEFDYELNYKHPDLSHYKKIVHIGDLQGCHTVLTKYFEENPISDDNLYIFTGDLLDRGIENDKVMKFVLDNYERDNFIFIEGNHEKHIRDYGSDKKSKSDEFLKNTKPQLDSLNIDKKEYRLFCGKLRQMMLYSYNGKKVLVSHGGLPFIPFPNEILKVSTRQYIHGVGYYSTDIDSIFEENHSYVEYYQIHGHRNIHKRPLNNTQRSFNLEAEVEFGGHLRIVEFEGDKINCLEYKNEIYNKERQVPHNPDEKLTESNIIANLRKNPHVEENVMPEGISSFNFTRNAFKKAIWNTQTTKARGLFINTTSGNIVARGYEKFFNVGEREETVPENLSKNMKFPVKAYLKENGYLGIVGYDKSRNELVVASKSSTKSKHAEWLRDLLNKYNIKEIESFVKENDCSLVFEVMDIVNDPHIIEYDESKIVLLNAIKNIIDYEKFNCDLTDLALKIGCEEKKTTHVITTPKALQDFLNVTGDKNYVYRGKNIEGFVLEDSDGFMCKHKLPYYSFWKFMRTLSVRVKNGRGIDKGQLNREAINFVNFCQELKSEELDTDIITLRNMYEKRTS